jgi:hypothetical protein
LKIKNFNKLFKYDAKNYLGKRKLFKYDPQKNYLGESKELECFKSVYQD